VYDVRRVAVNRINVTLDDEHAARLSQLAKRLLEAGRTTPLDQL
jgi:hypothetical protein